MQKKFGISLAAAVAGFATAANAAPPTIVSYPTAVNTDTVWGDHPDEAEIILDGAIFVKDNATLTILPGVIVRGQPRTAAAGATTVGVPGSLVVTRTGRLIAEGGPANPIVFTTAAVDNDANGEPDDLDASGRLDAYPGFDPVGCPGACVPDLTPTYYDANPKTDPLSPLSPAGRENLQLWGGLVLLGNAPTNLGDVAGQGVGVRSIEGLAVPGFPIADTLYGGTQPHDDSGSLQYLSIRHAGDEIGGGNELNGLTLGGVGDGTEISHIEIYCNFDDGFEWFGGTVNGKFLSAAFVGDDTFDLDQGYTGVNQYLFGVQPFFQEAAGTSPNAQYGSASGDKLGEFDGDDCGPDPDLPNNCSTRTNEDGSVDEIAAPPAPAWPQSNPAMYNMTVLGNNGVTNAGVAFPNTAKIGIQFRHGFAGDVLNSIVLNAGGAAFVLDTGLNESVNGGLVDAIDNVNDGLTRIVSTTMSGNGAAVAGNLTPALSNGDAYSASLGGGANVLNGGAFAGLINSVVSFDPNGAGNNGKLAGAQATPVNPRPAGPVGTTAATPGRTPGIDNVSYRGAFDPTQPALWTTGWTALNAGGFLAD
jgi:hypothetical protein